MSITQTNNSSNDLHLSSHPSFPSAPPNLFPFSLSILCWNINGLATQNYYSEKMMIFRSFIENNKPQVIFLQETHLSTSKEITLNNIPLYTWFFQHNTTNRGGLAIGVRNTLLPRNPQLYPLPLLLSLPLCTIPPYPYQTHPYSPC